MTTLNITDADRGPDGRILTERPRSLADLLSPTAATEALPARPAGSLAIPSRVQLAVAGIAGLLLVFALSFVIGRGSPTAPQAALPSPVVATAPAPSPVPAGAPHIIVAYAAPDGAVLGGFDLASERHTFVGRYGDDWVQIGRDSGPVWVRRSDLFMDGADLEALAKVPDLTPPTPAPAPPAQVIAPAAPAPTPTVCAVVGVAGAQASACGTADLDTLQATAAAQLMTDQHLRPVAVTTATPYGGSYATTP